MDLSNQAIKPRGNNMRERFISMITWYEDTSTKIETKDPYQIKLFDKMKAWTPRARNMLEHSDQSIVDWIKNEIANTNGKLGAFEQYLAIELARVINEV